MEPSRYVRVEGDRIELFTPLSELGLKSALGVLMTAVFATLGVIADTGSGRAIGWVGTALFAAATLLSARRLISSRRGSPALALDPDGSSSNHLAGS